MWDDLIQPYVHNTQILVCPAFKSMPSNEPSSGYANKTDYGYGVNICMGCPHGGCWHGTAANISQVVRPSQIVYAGDSGSAWLCQWNLAYSNTCQPCNTAYKSDVYSRHNDGANAVFVDGHAKWYSSNTYASSNWGNDHIHNWNK